jgi:hypothetical protein
MKEADAEDVVAEWRLLVEEEKDTHLRGDYVGLALVFAGLVAGRASGFRLAN